MRRKRSVLNLLTASGWPYCSCKSLQAIRGCQACSVQHHALTGLWGSWPRSRWISSCLAGSQRWQLQAFPSECAQPLSPFQNDCPNCRCLEAIPQGSPLYWVQSPLQVLLGALPQDSPLMANTQQPQQGGMNVQLCLALCPLHQAFTGEAGACLSTKSTSVHLHHRMSSRGRPREVRMLASLR